MPAFRCRIAIALIGLVAAGCGMPGRGKNGTCEPGTSSCDQGWVCDAVLDGEPRCVLPLTIRGVVLDLADQSLIEGALVQAVDINGAAVGTSGESNADGAYELTVPAVRHEEGAPVDGIYTLRVQAAAYQEFPTSIRPALPLDATTAEAGDEAWVIENALTTVGLIHLPGDTADLGAISGQIVAENNAGVLVVAEGADTAFTGFSDSDGLYTVFNVPGGSYIVRGYAAGVQVNPATATLESGASKSGVDLTASPNSLSTVSGNVQIVNASGDAQTSVVLAVESTFVEAAARGTVPPGLRVGEVVGAFSIENVPDGRYVVLAAFENDALVRDPDQTIGGTAIVRLELPDPEMANDLILSEGFKVTGALAIIAPGAGGPEQILDTQPTLRWEDDSSEDGYEIRVFDAFGTEVWADETGPVTGSGEVAHSYAGPPLEPGMFYQFRVTSFRERSGERTAISSTEDLEGVFFYLTP